MSKMNLFRQYDIVDNKIIDISTSEVVCDNLQIDVICFPKEIYDRLIKCDINTLSNVIFSSDDYLRYYGFTEEQISIISRCVNYYFDSLLCEKIINEENENLFELEDDKEDGNYDLEYENNNYEDTIDNYQEFLSVRSYNVLTSNNIKTLEQLCNLTYEELMKFKNCGGTSAKQILKLIKRIKNRKTNTLAENENSIEFYKDELSVRSYNVLMDNGINTIDKLMLINSDSIIKFRNCGKKSAQEIMTFIENISSKYISASSEIEYQYDSNGLLLRYAITREGKKIRFIDGSYVIDQDVNRLVIPFNLKEFLKEKNICSLYDILKNFYNFKSIQSFGAKKEKTVQSVVIEYLKENIYFENEETKSEELSKEITSIIIETKFDGVERTELIKQLITKYQEEDINNEIDKLINDRIIFPYEDNKLFYSYPSFPSYLYKLEKGAMKDILFSRIDGLTLEEISEKYGVTRERIRQKENKFLKTNNLLVSEDKIMFREDRFAYLFEKYNFSRKEFIEIFKEKERTYNYLLMIYKKGNIDFKEAVNDEKLASRFRALIERYNYRDYVQIENEYIPRTYSGFLKYFLKKYVQDSIRMDELYNSFNEFIKNYDDTIISPALRAFEGYFEHLKNVIKTQNKMVRYYDYSKYDFELLKEELNLFSYDGMFIST